MLIVEKVNYDIQMINDPCLNAEFSTKAIFWVLFMENINITSAIL